MEDRMRRVLITGPTGRLGGVFVSMWKNKPGYTLGTLSRGDVDLTHPRQLGETLAQLDFDLLINPAAMSGLEECMDNPQAAAAINTETPRVMAAVCREKGARFVHFSTDYVFGGDTPGKKNEDHGPSPVNTYGRTKLAGEQAVLEACPDAIIARVSWLFGPAPAHRPTHFDQAIARARSGETAQFIDDKFSMPTYMPDVVQWTGFLLGNNSTSGVYHLCNTGEPESWHSYAEKACHTAHKQGLDVQPVEFGRLPLGDATFFRETRPTHTAMEPNRIQKECGIRPRHWLEAAAEYVKIR